MDKLDFLNKYRDNVELVSINDVDSFITNEWKNVFKEETQNKRVKNTISIKNSIFRNSLIFQGLPPIKYQNLMYFPLFLPL